VVSNLHRMNTERPQPRPTAKWSWGPDPVKTLLFFLLVPALLLAGALGAMGWVWWQRLLAGVAGLALTAYALLALVGAWRRRGGGRPQRSERS